MHVLNLFKYYATKYKGEDNLSFYSEGSIYFQKPIKFNDPWDCELPQISIPRQKKTLKKFWLDLGKRKAPDFVKTEWQNIRNLPRTEIKRRVEELFKVALERLRSRIGVFSLSFIPDSELMWSHYASSHFGYMLHFQIDIAHYKADSSLMNVGIPIPVIYRDKMEVWNLANYETNRLRHYYDLVRFKSNAWAYECELRLLNTDKFGFIKTPGNWLKSIVIGINTDSELRDKLEDIGNTLKVSVLSSKMNKKEYKIDIPGLKINGNDGRTCYKDVINSKEFNLDHLEK
ncbi:MAG: DUF2971 domain-containing protein [Deltaproteobacteria bacterium]|nr:DUF2971 domain-containing protein [Deltaproteobacteria bacterium]